MFSLALTAATEHESSIAEGLLVILVSAGAVALVLQRVRMATIPAFLITGVIIGPHALGLVRSSARLQEISHLAIILLLFGIGLNLRFSTIKHAGVRLIALGVGSCVLSALIAWPIAMWFGLAPPAALAVCMGLALSSTAVVLRIISERRELQHAHGRLALVILVMQDAIVLLMLAALPLLGKWAETRGELVTGAPLTPAVSVGWLRFIIEGALRVGGVAALVAVGRLALPRLMRESLRAGSLEVLLIVGIAMAFATAYLTKMLGFSLEMGAFLAGLLLGGTSFRHQLVGQIVPLRDFFIAVFFTTVGMKFDPAVLIQWWGIIVIGTVMMMVLKSTVIGGCCWLMGATAGTAIAVGLSLSQAGEFSLILLDTANSEGLIAQSVTSVVIAIVIISLILTPAVDRLGRYLKTAPFAAGLAPWIGSSALAETADDQHLLSDSPKHVVIGGYGPIGRMIAEKLDSTDVRHTVIELNSATVREQLRQGKSFVFGDVSNPEVLESAGIRNAKALILTVPDEQAVIRACAAARRLSPEVLIVARTGLVRRQADTKASGADHVVVEEIAAAEAILHKIEELEQEG